jgi:tRNA pseudouridine55 synthase
LNITKQRRFHRDVDGILLLDKPLGLSSNAALQQARGLFGAHKAGHAGSLDPLASGLLPICFGQATKVCGRLLDAAKTYIVDVQLGARTESLDAETEIIERAAVPELLPDQVDAVLRSFMGEQQQIPPMHSALKHQGKRLYELARRGESVERPARQIVIHHIQRLGVTEDRLEFEVRCSKGTYIRTLAADIAAGLGTLGYLVGLRRSSIDPFSGLPMHTFDALESLRKADYASLDCVLLPTDVAFGDLAAVSLPAGPLQLFLLGQAVATDLETKPGSTVRTYDRAQRFLGLAEVRPDGRLQPVRLFVNTQGSTI